MELSWRWLEKAGKGEEVVGEGWGAEQEDEEVLIVGVEGRCDDILLGKRLDVR